MTLQREEVQQLQAEVARLRKEQDEARDALADYENSLKHALDDHPDEEHCACFPYLRAEVMSLRAEVERLRGWVKKKDKAIALLNSMVNGGESQSSESCKVVGDALAGPGDGEPETEWPTAKDLLSWPKECRDAYVRLSAHYAAKEGMYAEEREKTWERMKKEAHAAPPAEHIPEATCRCASCTCHLCGYNAADAQFHGDHHLCEAKGGKIPAPPAEEPEEEASCE